MPPTRTGLTRSEAGFRLGSDLGSPNHGSTLLSKRVMVQIRSPLWVRTERLFGETNEMKPMRLVDTKTVGDGLAFLSYELVRKA